MAILNRDILQRHGPYMAFVDCERRLDIPEGGWPELTLYQEGIFFEFADDLLETCCSLTHSYVFFDMYELTQLARPAEIFALSSGFLMWAYQVSRCRPHDLGEHLQIYRDSARSAAGEVPTPEVLRQDLMETLLFIAGRLHQVAFRERVVVIVGI